MKEKVLHDLTAFPAFGKSGGGEKSAGKPAAASLQSGARVRKGEGGVCGA